MVPLDSSGDATSGGGGGDGDGSGLMENGSVAGGGGGVPADEGDTWSAGARSSSCELECAP